MLLGCGMGMEETTRTISVDNMLNSYRHVSDLPWGAIPVCPAKSNPITGQLSIQAGGYAYSGMSDMDGRWSASQWQGTGDFQAVFGIVRYGVGARWGAAPSTWISLGLMGREMEDGQLFAEVAVGGARTISEAEYFSIRTVDVDGRISRDTSVQRARQRNWNPFFRLSGGWFPQASGPWGSVQWIPQWRVAEWPGGYRSVTSTTGDTAAWQDDPIDREYRENHEKFANLVSVGAGWTERLGRHALTVGLRYSARELRQLEMLTQLTAEF